MSLLESMIGLIAPPECLGCGAEGTALCAGCAAGAIQPFGERCWHCDKLSAGSRTCDSCRRFGGPRSVWICTTYEGLARQLVQAYKFGHLRAAAGPLSQMMADTFHSLAGPEAEYLVVPVPTATSRVRQRGFGHSELLARALARRLRYDYRETMRRLDQSRQLGARREDRLTQLTGSFTTKNSSDLRGRPVLLIDDVVTTGGTLIAAAQTLRAAGAARVDAVLFAKKL